MLQPSEILRRTTQYIVRQYVIIYSGISAGVWLSVRVCGSQKDFSEVDGMSWNSAVWFQAGHAI